MISFNGPFLIALIIIIFLIVIKWMEGFLFQDRSRRPKNRIPVKKEKVVRKENSRLSVFGKRLKQLLFFGKTDLKRPWYSGIPLALFIISNSLLNSYYDLQPWQIYLYMVVCIGFIIWFEIFCLFRANKEFFAEKEQRKRYIRTQIAQLILCLSVVALIFAGLQINFDHKYVDPPGLKESVDWVIEPVYEANWPEFTEGLAPVGYKGKMGFIDKKGSIAIPYQYNDADNFHEGLAAVQKDWRWGYIDHKGNVVIPFEYNEAFAFGDGLAPVKKDGKWMVIDRTGAVKLKTDYKSIYSFQEGVAQVEIRDQKYKKLTRYNLIDTEGRLLLQKDYVTIGNFSEGCVFVWDNEIGKGYYIDKDGKKAISRNFIDASGFSGGVAAVWVENEDYALIDRAGNIIRELNEEEYRNYMYCHEGLITINNGEWQGSSGSNTLRYGFKDIYGNVIIPAEFQDVTFSSDSMIGLTVDGLWGFIENPLPKPARGVDPEVWASDRTQIGTVEGLPVYAGELESYAYDIKKSNPELTGIPAYKKALEQIKIKKAYEKYGKEIDAEMIRYQIGDAYYKKLLLEIR